MSNRNLNESKLVRFVEKDVVLRVVSATVCDMFKAKHLVRMTIAVIEPIKTYLHDSTPGIHLLFKGECFEK